MTKRATTAQINAALKELDPAPSDGLTHREREHADTLLEQIIATPLHEPHGSGPSQTRKRRGRMLIPVGLAAAAVPAYLVGAGGNAFGSWTPQPTPLTASAAAAAATTCSQGLGQSSRDAKVVTAERRGGWTYVLFTTADAEGTPAEGSCLMPDDLLQRDDVQEGKGGFFGSYDTDPPQAPTMASNSLVETESMGGAVSVPARLPLSTDKGWFTWVNGYVGSNVTGVTVHPPVGPDVEASVEGGRFSAWWPAGEEKGSNPGVSGAWTYTVTLTNGSTRDLDAEGLPASS